MFEALEEAIAGLDPVADSASVAALIALDDRLHATVLASLAAFDAADGPALDGAGTLTAWLKHHTDRAPGAAATLARVAKLLARLPGTAAAYHDGRLSGGQLDAIVANLNTRTVEFFAEQEPELLPPLLVLPANDVARVMQEWRTRIEALLDTKEEPDRDRSFKLAATIDGRPLEYSDIEMLLCDCNLHRVLTDTRSVILDYGRATRTVPTPLFNALAVRDQGCRHPGCNAPVAWCDAHHVTHWANNGETNINNLVLKCRRHHRLAHKRRWREQLLPDGTLHITTETGHTLTSHPPGTLLAAA
jgi:hypothetical protein